MDLSFCRQKSLGDDNPGAGLGSSALPRGNLCGSLWDSPCQLRQAAPISKSCSVLSCMYHPGILVKAVVSAVVPHHWHNLPIEAFRPR